MAIMLFYLFFGSETESVSIPNDLFPHYEGAILKMVGTLCLIVIAMFITVWLLKRMRKKRWGKSHFDPSISILEKKMISPKTALYLIEIGKERVLIAESQLEIKKLLTLDKVEEETESKI